MSGTGGAERLPSLGGHASVIGGSLAGMLVARVLADHFEEVTIFERDHIDLGDTDPRAGVPQGNHVHLLLAPGLARIERWFPGITAELIDGGAFGFGREPGDVLWYQSGGLGPRDARGFAGLSGTRPFIEQSVRARVGALDNVTLFAGAQVSAVRLDPAKRRVVGLVTSGIGGFPVHPLDTDLVVDASGRSSRTPEWLTAGGYRAPDESQIALPVTYVSRLYRREPEDRAQLVIVQPAAPESRSASLAPVEGDRWLVSATGIADDVPEEDNDAFLPYLAGAQSSIVADRLAEREPLGDVWRFRVAPSRRRHYERLERLPEGWLVVGDALAAFSPRYGQGMTSTALQVAALEDALGSADRAELGPQYFAAAADVVDRPWNLNGAIDFRWPQAEGNRPAMTEQLNRYLARYGPAMNRDPVLWSAYVDVVNLAAPVTGLLHPSLLWRVGRARLRRDRGPAEPGG